MIVVSRSKKIDLHASAKTYNSGDSLVVTHLTTNPPVSCLTRAERTGSRVLKILWSYVEELSDQNVYKLNRLDLALQAQESGIACTLLATQC
jgi:hypothetical protein